jgi:hypothetical protein
MEQYWMPRQLDFEHLRKCLDNYPTEKVYIRDCGGLNPDGSSRVQGLIKVNESLEGKSLDFKKDKSGLHILIDSKEVFHFPLKDYYKGFSLAYERYRKDGRIIILSQGIDPYDPLLPEPKTSMLRNALDSHLVEISFQGRIPLKFHSWWNKKSGWKYWTIDI